MSSVPATLFRTAPLSRALPRLAFALLLALPVLGACSHAAEPDQTTDEPGYDERMSREHAGDQPDATPAAQEAPAQSVEEEDVVYARVGDRDVHGFLARPAGAEDSIPGIVVIHEWWGLNDNIRAMARRLAGEGYAALAVDLYQGQAAETPEKARELMSATNERTAEVEDNLRQAVKFLQDRGAERIGVIGWCFGGGWSLQTALLVPDEIDATVIYYGRLVTDPDVLANLQSPLLGIFGELDQGIPVDTVHEFASALDELGKDVAIQIYPGADHAFANPSGSRYQAEAADDAWAKTLAFFSDNLKRK
ncbi:MAG: dienelactone hydrolase family protein [Acidobacteria bacterium]|nr:dienelactone hydrolase family protein [Acidobacteriota bacterium]